MGQYWMVVNLDKKEFVDPHKLGTGLKLWEQLANSPGTGGALIILCAAMPEARGGGDFDLDKNWHGPERKDTPEFGCKPGPMPEEYADIAHRTIGRWAGDRIALVGDYAENSDLPRKFHAKTIFGKCQAKEHMEYNADPKGAQYQNMTPGKNYGLYAHRVVDAPSEFKDISEDVCAVIEHELNGKFKGDGWRKWTPNEKAK